MFKQKLLYLDQRLSFINLIFFCCVIYKTDFKRLNINLKLLLWFLIGR